MQILLLIDEDKNLATTSKTPYLLPAIRKVFPSQMETLIGFI